MRAKKQIRFTFEDREYTLEFTRKSIEMMERQGFVAGDIVSKPMTTLPALFAGAFLANHRFAKKEDILRMFDLFQNKQELIGKLGEMFNEPLAALVDDPEESEGNISWEASW